MYVQENLVGTDATGTNALGNGGNGLLITGDLGGGTSDVGRNFLSGNYENGFAVDATDYTIYQGPLFIGTDVTAMHDLGNQGNGIFVAPPGTFAPHAAAEGPSPPVQLVAMNRGRTIVAFNRRNGAVMTTSSDTRWDISGCSFFSNHLLAIDLGNDGVTPNDPCDSDSGPNDLQNYPILSAALSTGEQITITGSLDSLPNSTFVLDFFANEQCDPSGHGQGHFFLGSTWVTNSGNCVANFQVTFDVPVPVAYAVSAIATKIDSDGFGHTSEFGPCVAVAIGGQGATTLPPTVVTSSSARLNGAINPNGSDTTVWFEDRNIHGLRQ